jgi:hypothetical protein
MGVSLSHYLGTVVLDTGKTPWNKKCTRWGFIRIDELSNNKARLKVSSKCLNAGYCLAQNQSMDVLRLLVNSSGDTLHMYLHMFLHRYLPLVDWPHASRYDT